MTDTGTGDSLAHAIAVSEAVLSEGFCPFCGARLTELDDYDVERTRGWYAPPCAACLSCECVVGRYPEGGVYRSTLHHLDYPDPHVSRVCRGAPQQPTRESL